MLTSNVNRFGEAKIDYKSVSSTVAELQDYNNMKEYTIIVIERVVTSPSLSLSLSLSLFLSRSTRIMTRYLYDALAINARRAFRFLFAAPNVSRMPMNYEDVSERFFFFFFPPPNNRPGLIPSRLKCRLRNDRRRRLFREERKAETVSRSVYISATARGNNAISCAVI